MKYYELLYERQNKNKNPIRINITEQLSSPVDIFIGEHIHEDTVSETSSKGNLFDSPDDNASDTSEEESVVLHSLSMSDCSSDSNNDEFNMVF